MHSRQTSSLTHSGAAPKMGRRVVACVTGVGLLATAVIASPAANAEDAPPAAPRRIMSGWLPYWTTAESVNAFVNNADLFSDISPFWHNAAKSLSTASGVKIENNSLSSGTRASNLAILKGRGVEILPSITDGTGAGHMSSVMRNAAKSEALVNQIVALVESNGYDGIDLDFEKFAFSDGQSTWAKTRPAWVDFVKSLSAQLHARGKKLAVAVPPMGVSSGNYWVYDWAAIGPYIDKLRIMAYDYSWSTPGPVGGPLSWVEAVSEYAVSVLPPSKVQLGTPTYGRDWYTGKKSGTGCPASGNSAYSTKVYDSNDIGSVIGNTPASSWKRDAKSQERYFNYSVKLGDCTIQRSAWVPDSQTVIERAKIASKYGLNGLATWTIGGEQASQWEPLRTIALTMPFSAGQGLRAQSVAVKVSSKKGRKGRKVVVSGVVSPARSGAPVRLRVKRAGKWLVLKKTTTNENGTYRFTIRPKAAKNVYHVHAPKSGGYLARSTGTFTIRSR